MINTNCYNSTKERKTQMSGRNRKIDNLLSEVVKTINGEFDKEQDFTSVLRNICESFSFSSACIYECDYTNHLCLKENWSIGAEEELITSIKLDLYMNDEQIESLISNPILYSKNKETKTDVEKIICDIFNAERMYTVCIIDNNQSIIGWVGIFNELKNTSENEEEVIDVCNVLNLISESVKLRIFKKRLQYTYNTLEKIMDHTGIDIYVNDYYTHEMLYANESMALPYGGWENMKGKTCYEALYDNQTCECAYCPKHKLVDANGNPTKTYIWDYQRPFDLSWFRVICTAFEWIDGRLAQVISSVDITKEKENELLIKKIAFTDTLTGIGNRYKLEQDFNTFITEPEALSNGVTMFFIDLDMFKEVNDTYGHSTGDLLLRELAKLFQSNPITKDCCYRYGGDEFIILQKGIIASELEQHANKLVEIASAPIDLECIIYKCSISVGWATFPEDGNTYAEILDNADAKMYLQKVKHHKR